MSCPDSEFLYAVRGAPRRFFCRTAHKIAMSEQLLDPTLLLGELAADFTAKADLGA